MCSFQYLCRGLRQKEVILIDFFNNKQCQSISSFVSSPASEFGLRLHRWMVLRFRKGRKFIYPLISATTRDS